VEVSRVRGGAKPGESCGHDYLIPGGGARADPTRVNSLARQNRDRRDARGRRLEFEYLRLDCSYLSSAHRRLTVRQAAEAETDTKPDQCIGHGVNLSDDGIAEPHEPDDQSKEQDNHE